MTDAKNTNCGSVPDAIGLLRFVATMKLGRGMARESVKRQCADMADRLESEMECRSVSREDVRRQLGNAISVGSWEMVAELLASVEETEQESATPVDVWDVLSDLYTRGRLAGTTLDAIQEEYKARVRATEEKSVSRGDTDSQSKGRSDD